jgi:hypothetical protein
MDGVRSFSPMREKWAGKPKEELPKKVTVRFETGPAAILDMSNTRAILWANLLDLQKRHGKAGVP